MPVDFEVGDRVAMKFRFADHSGQGLYEITRVLPRTADGQAQYRIVGADGCERVIGGDQIAAASDGDNVPSPD